MTGFDKTGGGGAAGESDPSSFLLLHRSLSAQWEWLVLCIDGKRFSFNHLLYIHDGFISHK